MSREERALLREKRKFEQQIDTAINASTINEDKTNDPVLPNFEHNPIEEPNLAKHSSGRICRRVDNDVIKVCVDDIDKTSKYEKPRYSRRKAIF